MEKDILDPFGFPIHDENQHTPQTFEWNTKESPDLISQFSPRFTSAARHSIQVEPKQLFQSEDRLLNDITDSDSQNSPRQSSRLKKFYASRNLRQRSREFRNSTPVRQSQLTMEQNQVSVAWPGTLNENDDTVQEESSHESLEHEDMAKSWMQKTNREETGTTTREEKRSSMRRRKIEQLRRRVAEFHDSFLEEEEEEEEEEEDVDVVDLDQDPTEYSHEKPSDRHLAAALSNATSVESSPENSPARNILNISHDSSIPENDTVEVYELDTRQIFSTPRKKKHGIDTSNSMTRIKSAGKLSPSLEERARRQNLTDENGVARLCAAALKDRECTFQTVAHGANVKGYKGFINKTQDVPNLIDDLSVTSASTVATNTVTPKKYALHAKMDVEEEDDDNVSVSSMQAENSDASVESNSRLEKMQSQVDIVRLNASFSTVQTTSEDYARRQSSHDFDAGLTESDTDYAATTRKGTAILNQEDDDDGYFSSSSSSDSEEGSSDYNLSQYRVNEEQNKRLVKAYRNMSKFTSRGSYSGEDEGAKQSFALVEFRSRIMASDIERGFERMGGTTVVDDIVLTNHYQTKCRVRDAVIVSKAWREGTCPKDAITAKNLIGESDFYVKRSSRPISSSGSTSSTSLDSLDSTCSKVQIVYERIDWCDDTDLSLLACFGSKTLRGTDIFTEGDCQSMLLKLTHEHCEILREDLNEAIARKNGLEIAEDFLETVGEMSDAELEYFEVMVEVEALTSKLEKAERAFESVKHEIESLVKEYEDMLEDMDNSSSSDDDEDCRSSRSESSDSSSGRYERERLARRAQRAELNAEIAAKEIENKEKELVELRQKLDDLEAQSAIMASDYEAKLKTHSVLSELTAKLKDASFDSATTTQKSLIYAASTVGTDPDQDGAKARLKAKFRERRLSKITDDNKELSERKDSEKPSIKSTTNKQRLSGKLHQRLEFFERSLKSINES